jgi:hypothetical protein
MLNVIVSKALCRNWSTVFIPGTNTETCTRAHIFTYSHTPPPPTHMLGQHWGCGSPHPSRAHRQQKRCWLWRRQPCCCQGVTVAARVGNGNAIVTASRCKKYTRWNRVVEEAAVLLSG